MKADVEGDATSKTGSKVTTTDIEACVKGQASTEEHPGRGDGIRQSSW